MAGVTACHVLFFYLGKKMALTRAQIESVLLSRCKRRMELVGFNIVASGNNTDLNDPISTALQLVGITPTNIACVVDGDLATITDHSKLIDLAEIRLLENILGNFDLVTLQAASGTEHFSDGANALEKIIARKHAEIEKKYGIGAGLTVSGKRKFNFQAKAS
ncbi:MAG: hypothetical protein IPL32_18120 [Chloracidobacterium sp.]|nr:hypothetical protein [Chloracidobacterium sp.]